VPLSGLIAGRRVSLIHSTSDWRSVSATPCRKRSSIVESGVLILMNSLPVPLLVTPVTRGEITHGDCCLLVNPSTPPPFVPRPSMNYSSSLSLSFFFFFLSFLSFFLGFSSSSSLSSFFLFLSFFCRSQTHQTRHPPLASQKVYVHPHTHTHMHALACTQSHTHADTPFQHLHA
jgi:hypothetical protein